MGIYLYKPVKDKYSEDYKTDRFICGVSCMQGWRTSQEDTHNCILNYDDGISYFAVHDGHLGCEVAVYCSLHLPDHIKQTAEYKSKDYKQALISGFVSFDDTLVTEEVQKELLTLTDYNAKKYPFNRKKHIYKSEVKQYKTEKLEPKERKKIESGCTAVVALITKDCIFVANAGDSRCFASQAGVVLDLSFDHKPCGDEESRIMRAGGYVNNGRVVDNLNLSRSFGDHQFKQNKSLPSTEQMIIAMPDVVVYPITPDIEFLVLVCDGITESKNNKEVVDFVGKRLKKKMRLSEICEEMFDSVLGNDSNLDGSDNMSMMIVQFLHGKRTKSRKKTS